jgi:TBC1 domain family member 13
MEKTSSPKNIQNIINNITNLISNPETSQEKIKDSLLEQLSDHKFFGIIVSKVINVSSEKLKNKIIDIIKNLNSSKINYPVLRKIVFEGLPDDIPSMRSLIWKLLLDYLSLNVNEWEESIDKKRAEYNEMKKSIFSKLDIERLKKAGGNKTGLSSSTTPTNKNISKNDPQNNSITPNRVIKKKNISDHPLATTGDSKWKNYFDDLDLLEEIDKDVRRTRTNMHFFFMPAKSNLQTISTDQIIEFADKKRNDPSSNVEKFLSKNGFDSNADVMCRILFIYGKKYPEIRYVQGMNEVLAPIYYAFSNDQNPYFYTNLEADCYICFENLMKEIKDIFIRSKDNLETGIHTRVKNLNLLLKMVDKEIFNHFAENKIEVGFFAFRWYTLFLTQEFEMPDILRLWDSILSEDDKFDFLNMVCLAIIKMKKIEILQSDFAGIMLSMQNLDKLDVEKVIKVAESIRLDLNKGIY